MRGQGAERPVGWVTALRHWPVIVFFFYCCILNKVLKWSDREETLRIQGYSFFPLLMWPEREASFAPGLARTVAQEAHRGLSSSGYEITSFVCGREQVCLTWL